MSPDAAWYILAIPLVAASVLLHEAGHVITARIVGGRWSALGLGLPVRPARAVRAGGVVFFAGPNRWDGLAAWLEPPRGGWTARTWGMVLVGGPVANVVAGLLLLGTPGDAWDFAGVINLVTALANLMPGRGSPSDGQQLWRMLRGAPPAQAEHGHLRAEDLLERARFFEEHGAHGLARAMRTLGT